MYCITKDLYQADKSCYQSALYISLLPIPYSRRNAQQAQCLSRCYQTPLAPGASSRRSLALFPLCRPLGQRGRSSPLAARPLLNDARSNCAHHRTHWRALPPALRRGNQRETDVFKLHRPRSFGFRPRPTCARGVYTSLCVKTCRSFSLIALPEASCTTSVSNQHVFNDHHDSDHAPLPLQDFNHSKISS